jgi:hypothetical protein
MRESFGGSAREEAAKKFNNEMKKGALDHAFKNLQGETTDENIKLEQPKEFELELTTEDIDVDKEQPAFKPGVENLNELGDELDPEKLGASDKDEKLELDN